ncbi:MAG: HAMP domain-containing sensor histidine kinase [Candidatus Korobacteraceae bacterium]
MRTRHPESPGRDLKTKTLSIEVERKYDYDGAVFGSLGELRQVFSNLIVNAMDALAANGNKLIISVRSSRRWDAGVQGVRVSILDNGPGIASDHLCQLFQAFYTTKGERGTGIGLWVSSTIIKKHGGNMRVHSSVRDGRTGTCFSVFLPIESVGELSRAV